MNIAVRRGFATSRRNTFPIMNYGFLCVVGEKYATLIHRFGKFDRQMTPGINFKIPVIEQVAYVHDLREQVIEITSLTTTDPDVNLYTEGSIPV